MHSVHAPCYCRAPTPRVHAPAISYGVSEGRGCTAIFFKFSTFEKKSPVHRNNAISMVLRTEAFADWLAEREVTYSRGTSCGSRGQFPSYPGRLSLQPDRQTWAPHGPAGIARSFSFFFPLSLYNSQVP